MERMERVLLIIPPQQKIIDVKQLGSKWPRIGIAYLAAYLRERGVAVGILDCKAEEIDMEGAVARISDFQPDIIGISAYTEEVHEAASVCQAVKKSHTDIITVIGGAHASALPERVLTEFGDIDIAVYGEGEETLWNIIQAKEDSELAKVDGIAYRGGEGIIRNKPRALIKDIDSLPYPAWDLFPLELYRGITMPSLGAKGDSNTLELPILSTRGCPYKCNFCFHVYGNSARFRDYKKVVDEIGFLIDNYGATQFFFADGTFGIRKGDITGLCNEIIKRELHKKIKWTAPTRADAVTEESLRLMKRAGCLTCGIGIESGDSQILEDSGKGETKEQIKRAVAAARKVGLPIEASFIIGHPKETRESIQHTIDFIKELDVDMLNIAIMIPYPGTKVHQMAEKGEGNYRLLTKDWSEYTKQRGGPLELKDIPLRELRKIQARCYLRYYLRPKKWPYVLKTIPPSKMISIIIDLLRNSLFPH